MKHRLQEPDTRMEKCVSRLKTTFIATAVSLLCLNSAVADDTEVFFGQVDRTKNTQPNVLFVLDTSGSMNWPDNAINEPRSRLERMKEAMTTILNESDNVNVGIMRFNGGSGGGAVLYPVTEDDAEERSDFTVTTAGNVLSVTDVAVGIPERKIGLRFTGLNIPQGATITSASIGVIAQAESTIDGTESIYIKTENVDNAAPYVNVPSGISGRTYGAEATWSPRAWNQGELYDTVDLSAQVQEVVSRPGWCGGNSMSFALGGDAVRDIVSFEGSPANAPVLKVTYDSSTIPVGGGCAIKYAVSRIGSGANDAEQRLNRDANPWSNDLELFTDGGNSQTIGLRFTNVQLPRNAIIREARIEFEMDRNSFGTQSGIIYGEDKNSPEKFRRRWNDITRRTKTTAAVPWNGAAIPPLTTNDKLTTPDVSTIVSEITSRGGWNSGNSMVFIMDDNGSTGKHATESYNGEAAAAPKLIVEYQSFVAAPTEAPTYITARDRLLTEITGMTATGGTPIVDAYWEASQYLLGGDVDYGTRRGTNRSRFHRVSHPLSYVGGNISRRNDCTDANLDSSNCTGEEINGNPVYISPMESSCQTNHIVLLSDGDATSNSAVGKIQAKINDTCDASGDSDEVCGSEFAQWLADTDHSAIIDGDQNISTYTIGFNIDHPFLASIAANGGGRYFRADSADQLVARFQEILSDVYSIDTSFVAPGATVNQFNRLTHRNDIYFALFKPNERPNWSGNLKKYEIGLEDDGTVTIFDHSTPKKDAVNHAEGFFDAASRSDWSTVVDGNNVALGGASETLRLKSESGTGPDGRQLYTYLGDMENLPLGGIDIRNQGHHIHESNNAFTNADLDLSGSDGNVDGVDINKANLLQWARGIDVKDEDGDGNSNEIRQHIGDPMHSRPLIMNYSNGTNDPYTTVFMGTNEGVFHAFDNLTGEELFSFMPKSLLGNIKENFTNSTATRHPYGLDGPMTTWTVDINNNVMVDSNEDAMMFLGMRRGGSSYFAFDVSNREFPVLKWTITGGTGGTPGFEQLGQSWSRMVPTKLVINGQQRSVLIFGGGYDESNDVDYTVGVQPKGEDTIGRSIFIVDANNGDLLYRLGHSSDVGANQKLPDMKYAIPSDIRVVDLDTNGFADSMFVGDMGGQVWRFDFNLYHKAGEELIYGDQPLAKLGVPHNDVANARRFFYEPDVALIRENGERFLSISIGSGWRSHPLNTDVEEGFYMIRSNDVFNLPQGYGKRLGAGSYTPITEADLTDVSNDLSPNVGQYGWKLKFDRPGEKVLGDAITLNGQIVFTSYLPESNVAACSSALGSGAVYAMRVSDARPTLDLDGDGQKTLKDRSDILNHGGVPPEATALIVEGANGEIKPTILVGPEQPLDGVFDQSLTEREFWIDAGMTKNGAKGANIDGRATTQTAGAGSGNP